MHTTFQFIQLRTKITFGQVLPAQSVYIVEVISFSRSSGAWLASRCCFVSFAGAQEYFIILQNETMPLDDAECSLSDWCVDWIGLTQFDTCYYNVPDLLPLC